MDSLVIEHASDPPSPWGGYRLCLQDIPEEASHLLIVQDDALPCENFAPAAHQVAEANPSTPVCLFLALLPRDTRPRPAQALKMNRRYVMLSWRSFMPIVAVLWPRAKAVEFKEWAEQHPYLPGNREPRSDDAMAGRWKMVTRQTVLATVPSLVDHPDLEPSLVGRRPMWGKDKGRVAAFPCKNGLDYDWSMP